MKRLVAVVFSCMAVMCHAASDVSAESAVSDVAVQNVIKHICSDGGEWLKCYSVEPAKCESVTAGYVRPCINKTFGRGDPMRNGATTEVVLQRLLGCFNNEFMTRYGAGKRSTPECQKPPAHLQ